MIDSIKSIKAVSRISFFFLFFLFSLFFMVSSIQAQDEMETMTEREILDINTIATLSVGLVIQSYGYIGTYADLLGNNVYEPGKVTQMLGDTVKYLENALYQLRLYESATIDIKPGDKQYLKDVAAIIVILIQEAKSLQAFAQTHAEPDLLSYKEAREKAWKLISRTFNVG
ncbi:MAG: hypothetical protein LBF22_06990 [Deltaproteobacteria bacterium]|jgi:hypothetical protein|nr:hypothetical protein [Deltaproteobacteria bacterium]